MPVYDKGTLNVAALSVPNLYVGIVPPQVTLVGGVATDVAGIVGVASWGTVNSPIIVGDAKDAGLKLGGVQKRKYDAASAVLAANYSGSQNHRVVRVTDGTDTAAALTVQASAVFTARYTGSAGNSIVVTLAAGSAANSWKLSIQRTGYVAEVYDNITGTGAAFWTALANAVNGGVFGQSGPSETVICTQTGATAPVIGTYTLSGGTDGASGVTDAMLLGTNASNIPTGMYALEGSAVRNFALCDVVDSTTFAAQIAFGAAIGANAVLVGGAGESVAAAVTKIRSGGIDTWHCTYLLGDWIYASDGVSERLMSPQGFYLGRKANLSPEQSVLNKPIGGITATQRSRANRPYTQAELALLNQNGIEVITNNITPSSAFFGCRNGLNTASDKTVNGDNYTSMTNFLAYSIDATFGKFVGRLHNPRTRLEAKGALTAWLQDLADLEMIGTPDGSPAFQVILGNSNNSRSRAALGYMQADVKVIYQNIIRYFLVNLEGGQAVQINTAPSV